MNGSTVLRAILLQTIDLLREGPRSRVSLDGHSLALYCDTKDGLAEVSSFVGSCSSSMIFRSLEAGDVCEIGVTTNPVLFTRIAEVARISGSECGDRLVLVTRNETSTGRVHFIFEEGKRVLLVVAEGAGSHATMAAVRAARAILLHSVALSGWHYLHAACAVTSGRGLAITGNKFAGKTTTLLNLLSGGWNYVSNDKVAIKVVDGSVRTLGFPTHAGVRDKSLTALAIRLPPAFKEHWESRLLARTEEERAESRVYFSPAEFGRFFGVGVTQICDLRAFVFPEYDEAIESPRLERIEEGQALELLARQRLFALHDMDEEQAFLAQLFPSNLQTVPETLGNEMEEICCRVPCFRLLQNERLNAQVEHLLASYLAQD